MHVGLLIFGDINQQSGGYLYDRQLVSYLERQGDHVEIISLKRGCYAGELMRRTIPEGLSTPRLDILIQDELVYPGLFNINGTIQRELNCPLVSLVHLLDSTRPQNRLRRLVAQWAERRYLRSVDGLILNSTFTRRRVMDLLGTLPKHVIALPAANHHEPTTPVKVCGNSSRLNILYAGNVIQQKGLHVLVDAMGYMDSEHLHLTVAGRLDMEPAYVQEVKRKITRLKLEQRVEFRGALTPADLANCYRNNNVMVLPSVNEAYGIVYIEAQRFGLPVIGTRAGGAREIIQHGENGYLIEAQDSKSLAELLSQLLNEPEHLRAMGKKALSYYAQHPSWDDSCARIRKFLLETSNAWKMRKA